MQTNALNISISEAAIKIGQVNCVNGKYLCNDIKTYQVNNWATAEGVVKHWVTAITDYIKDKPCPSLHIAIPGPFDYTKGISFIKENRNLQSLFKVNVKQLLSQQLAIDQKHIHFFNDAVCALAAEFCNSAIKHQTVLGLFFDEGFGSALIKNGEIKDVGLWNKPFLDGKTEDYFSIKWLRKSYFQLTGLNIIEVNEINSFSSAVKKELYKTFAENLVQYIQVLLQEYNTPIIIMGGSIWPDWIDLIAKLKKKLKNNEVELRRSKLNVDAPILGTAALNDKVIIEVFC